MRHNPLRGESVHVIHGEPRVCRLTYGRLVPILAGRHQSIHDLLTEAMSDMDIDAMAELLWAVGVGVGDPHPVRWREYSEAVAGAMRAGEWASGEPRAGSGSSDTDALNPLEVEHIMIHAIRAGVTESEFWDSCPRQLRIRLAGHRKRVREHQEAMGAFHLIVANQVRNAAPTKGRVPQIRMSQVLPKESGIMDLANYSSAEEFTEAAAREQAARKKRTEW